MKKILITGCNGQLGRALNQVYKNEDVEFINTDVVEGEGIYALISQMWMRFCPWCGGCGRM